MNSYRYNNNICDINFRYIVQTKIEKTDDEISADFHKISDLAQYDYHLINKSVKVDYYKMIDLLGLKNTNDDLGVSYNKCTTRQLQKIQMTLLKTKDLNIIKCNVYVDEQVIL